MPIIDFRSAGVLKKQGPDLIDLGNAIPRRQDAHRLKHTEFDGQNSAKTLDVKESDSDWHVHHSP